VTWLHSQAWFSGRQDAGRLRNIGLQILPTLHPAGCEIQKAKQIDLLSLLPFIPPIYYLYYINLKQSGTVPDNDLVIGSESDNEDFSEDPV